VQWQKQALQSKSALTIATMARLKKCGSDLVSTMDIGSMMRAHTIVIMVAAAIVGTAIDMLMADVMMDVAIVMMAVMAVVVDMAVVVMAVVVMAADADKNRDLLKLERSERGLCVSY
jgi:hypothetical protein